MYVDVDTAVVLVDGARMPRDDDDDDRRACDRTSIRLIIVEEECTNRVAMMMVMYRIAAPLTECCVSESR